MSDNERLAVLEERVRHLEADEVRQRNSRNRLIGWAIGPSVALFLAGLSMYGEMGHQDYVMEQMDTKIEKLETALEKAIDTYSAAIDVYNHNKDIDQ